MDLKLKIDNLHKKNSQAYVWEFNKKSFIKIKVNETLKNLDDDFTFLTNIYMEEKINSKIYFEFLNNEKVIAKFEANLNFIGWQCILVPFKDMNIYEYSDITSIRIFINKKGTLSITKPEFVKFDKRYPTPDYSLPFVNLETNKSINKNWTALLMYDNFLNSYINKNKEYKDIEYLDDIFNKIYEIEKKEKYTDEDLINQYKKMDIYNNYIYSKYFSSDSINLREFSKLMLKISYNINNLENIYVEMFNYLYLQGFRKGSNFVTTDHIGYDIREIFISFVYAKDVLKKYNLLDKAIGMLSWYNGLGRIINIDIKEVNIDILNTQLKGMLYAILFMNNDDLMIKFKEWIEKNILVSKGLLGGFKKDYSMFHHCQHYVAYGLDALKNLLPVVYILKNTKYSICSKAYNKLQKVLERLKIYTQNEYVPISLSGRHPDESYKIPIDIYKYLDKKNIENKNHLFSMNYAGLLVKKTKNNTLFLVRGFSRYLVGNESYTNQNMYGRYNLYGRYEIIPNNIYERGYRFDNFNFSHFDGTTSLKKEKVELKSKLNHLKCAGIEEMLLSTERFLGVNVLDNIGIFGIRIRGHSKYKEQDLYANKSYFVLNNNIVCLGSDISKNAITTVFQNIHYKNKNISKKIKIFDTTYLLENKKDYILENNILYINHKNKNNYRFDILLDNSKKENYKILNKNKNYHLIKYLNYMLYVFFYKTEKIKQGIINSVSIPCLIILKNIDNKFIFNLLSADLNLYSDDFEKDQFVDGIQQEVSIYSRKWIKNEPLNQEISLILNGEYYLKNKRYGTIEYNNKTNLSIVKIQINGYKERKIILYKK